jgi:MFS family permease
MVLLPSILLGFIFGVFYLLLSTIAMTFQVRYHFSQLASSLVYLGLGVGMLFGLAVFGYIHGTLPKHFKHPSKPEIQLLPMIVGAPLASIGLLIFGWAVEKEVHWMVAVLGMSIFSMSLVGFMFPMSTYLVSVFKFYAASALAATSIMRMLSGALIPLCADRLYHRFGDGWGNTLLAGLALCLTPVPWFFYKKGEYLRERYAVQM